MLPPFSLLFYKGDSLVSRLIKGATGGKYSHCAMILDDGLHVLESDYKTPTLIKHLDYSIKNYDIYIYNGYLPNLKRDKIKEFVYENINSSYDFKYFFSRGLNRLIGTPIINNPNLYNCDELIVEAFLSAGIRLVDDYDRLTPQYLSESSKLIRVK